MATPVQPSEDPSSVREQIAEEALYRYFNPFASLEEIKPLKESKQPMIHHVTSGETLSEIAKRYDVTVEQLTALNHLPNPDVLSVGMAIKIPYREKEIRIEKEYDLGTLAKAYNVSKTFIQQMNPALGWTDGDLYIGQVVSVPKPVDVKTGVGETKAPEKRSEQPTGQPKGKKHLRLASRAKSVPTFAGWFAWPVGGQITSPYGWRDGRLHRGIDIWNPEEGRTPIKAAAAGTVTRAGRASGYGNLIVIDHGDGWCTYYGHLRAIQVSIGQRVSSGEQIGIMGNTGNSTGYHLHFEVRRRGQSMNPLNVLP